MKPDGDVKMDINPAYGCDIKMDANPAYQAIDYSSIASYNLWQIDMVY